MTVSYFIPFKTKAGKLAPGVNPKADIDFDSYLTYIREGKWDEPVLNYRAGKAPKESVPAITPSGTFSYRTAKSIIQHSGAIALDFDEKDNEVFPADEVAMDQYVYAMHRSVGGKGWVVYVKITPDPEKHTDIFLALEKHFANEYKVIVDQSGKDVSRLRYVSYDPELYHNPQAKVWKRAMPKKSIMPAGRVYVHTRNDVEHIINQMRSRVIDITDDYSDWIKTGMAIASEYGEQGREYFHQISGISAKYDQSDCDRKYDNILKTNNGAVTIASLFWLAQLSGLETKTPRTAHIERVAKMQRRVIGTNGGHKDKEAATVAAVKTLDEMDGINGPDVEDIVDQVMALPESQIKNEQSDDLIADLKEFLRTYEMRFNEVTRYIEIDSENMTDREFNSIYIKALEVLGTAAGKGKSISKDLLMSIIDSEFTKPFHPFRDFFVSHANMKPKGEIDKLLASIKMQPIRLDDGRLLPGKDYLNLYARKWLLSCVASWHGTYSVMMLVLCGEQMNGKTRFFRDLLPDELQRYYGESTLTNGKDDEILMCQKAIICDDEFGGKDRRDYRTLKALISKQKFSIRKPYGKITEDLTRFAVLCGTSNEDEVIDDPTGNRRIIPVQVERIDWDEYQRVDKAALWMELYHEWKKSGDAWMMTKTEVKALNKLTLANTQVSREEELLLYYFDHPDNGGFVEYMTNTEILNHIQSQTTRINLSTTKLGIILKKCGFEKEARRHGVTVRQVYKIVKRQMISENVTGFDDL